MFRTRIEVVLNLPEGRAPVSSSYRTLRDRLVRFCGHTEHTGTVQWGVYRADTSGTLVRTLSCGRCRCGDNGKTALPPQVAQQLAFIILYADELHRENTLIVALSVLPKNSYFSSYSFVLLRFSFETLSDMSRILLH